MWKKLIINYWPFSEDDSGKLWVYHGIWPAMWIAAAKECESIPVSAFRCHFNMPGDERILLHLSADAQYRLYCDGQHVASGPERGDCQNYFFDTFSWDCSAGDHTLVALVFNGGDSGAFSRMGLNCSFLLAAEGERNALLRTGAENWDACVVPGISFDFIHDVSTALGNGVSIDRNIFPAGIESGSGEWSRAVEIEHGSNASGRNEYHPGHLLCPATLPPQCEDLIKCVEMVYVGEDHHPFYSASENTLTFPLRYDRGEIEIPARSKRKILFRLEDYYCANASLRLSGGKNSRVSLKWAEALELEDKGKGNREDHLNRNFVGVGDCFIASGGKNEDFFTINYRAGRYVEMRIETFDEPLLIERFELRESRYPLMVSAKFSCSDAQYQRYFDLARRTLEMCMHDTYIDCPFYEQLMYIGDSRLQMLVNYTLSNDASLAEKSLRLMASSILPSGFLPSRYPSRVTQIIPPFSLFYPAMVCDYVKYCNRPRVTSEIVPVSRRVLDNFERYVNADNLLELPMGWGFVDWIPRWNRAGKMGTPQNAEFGVSGVINALYLYSLGQACELHELLGEKELAARYRRMGTRLAENIFRVFFSPEYGMLSDCLSHDEFSEHSQCLALLSNLLSDEQEEQLCRGLFSGIPEIAETTLYFDFYYLDACYKAGRMDCFHKRLSRRFDAMDGLGLKTLLERSEPSRSDCHAWSSHIIYHYFASILGIRPAAAGFSRLAVMPCPEYFSGVSGTMPTTRGNIEVDWLASRGETPLKINVPPGRYGGKNTGVTSRGGRLANADPMLFQT